MHGGAVTLADRFLRSDSPPDLLLATDMLDLTTFLSLTRGKSAGIPVAIYFHENQLSYPWSPTDRDVLHRRDRHYGFINYVSALAADAVFFNSGYHRDSFLNELPRFLRHFPDQRNPDTVDCIRAKSSVLPLGLDLARFDAAASEVGPLQGTGADSPLILWNHRWEFDKNPAEFFSALTAVAERGLDFRVAVLGECFSRKPREFLDAKEALGDRIVRFGHVDGFAAYASWLWQGDVLPVTSIQDFFGGSVVEAVYCRCIPLLPRRLAYPELIPRELHDPVFYADFDDLLTKLESALTGGQTDRTAVLRQAVSRFDWSGLAPVYDTAMEKVLLLA